MHLVCSFDSSGHSYRIVYIQTQPLPSIIQPAKKRRLFSPRSQLFEILNEIGTFYICTAELFRATLSSYISLQGLFHPTTNTVGLSVCLSVYLPTSACLSLLFPYKSHSQYITWLNTPGVNDDLLAAAGAAAFVLTIDYFSWL